MISKTSLLYKIKCKINIIPAKKYILINYRFSTIIKIKEYLEVDER
jgi:hypothetical protein